MKTSNKNNDITEDDGQLPSTKRQQDINELNKLNRFAQGSANSTIVGTHPCQANHRGQKLSLNNEKVSAPSRYNHCIYRAYVRGKVDRAKRLIDDLLSKSAEAACEYAFLIRALIAREEGQIRESMDWLTKATEHNPYSLQLTYEVGRTHMLLGEHEKASVCFQRCIDKDSNNWKYYYWKATTLYHKRTKNQMNIVKEAQECLLQCPQLNKSVNILMFVAKTCIQNNDIVAAIEAYKIEPENLEVISHLGLLYLKTGNEEKAFSCLGKALTYNPNHMPSIIAAASVLQTNGDFDVALSKYRVAANSCDHNGIIWNNIGMCFLGKGKLVASISCLKRANYLCPLDWEILFNLAIVHCSMLQYASAFNFMSSALNLNPRNKLLLMGLAIVLTKLNDHVNARKAYKRALQIDPDDFVCRLNYAVFEYRHGSVDDCRKILHSVKAPRNIDQNQFSDIKQLAERLQNVLRSV